uniref:Protein FAM136A n=2 Tax=Timema TaxID=61471 RepID=A0A7R9ES17_9NEOP|nr:unnamed protein product [Timema shepardi]CAD7440260.1 unnamed protein product [Timema bartmani]
MVEEQKERVETAMQKLVNDVDKIYLRKLQGDMHRCAAKCCDNNDLTVEKVHQCVERCSISLHQAQNFVQVEIDHMHNRLQRCVMQCNDEIKDKMGPNPNENEVMRYTQMFEKCTVKCVDTHIDLIPNLLARMKQVLAQGKQQAPM